MYGQYTVQSKIIVAVAMVIFFILTYIIASIADARDKKKKQKR